MATAKLKRYIPIVVYQCIDWQLAVLGVCCVLFEYVVCRGFRSLEFFLLQANSPGCLFVA